jgi:molybdate transport system substrate-binding protein
MRRGIVILALLAFVGSAVWLLGRGDPDRQRAPVVLAASSLQEALEAAAEAWAAKGHKKPVLSFAASSALARQIEAGAPADLFISADEEWMDALEAKHLVRQGSRVPLLGNSLVLIARASSKADLIIAPDFPIAGALEGGRLALADPSSVPAGRYAQDAFEHLGVWPQVSDHIAAAQNVRAALALVARGEAPLGVVYATDAQAEPKVRVVDVFPPSSHAPIVYPIAILKRSTNPEADDLRTFLLSPEGKAVFQRFGFTDPAS